MTTYTYPMMARIHEWDFVTNTVTELWFDTRTQAMKYYESKRDNDKIKFSPIEMIQVAR
jgi:hypothetical protein